jgi:hypothetical protein
MIPNLRRFIISDLCRFMIQIFAGSWFQIIADSRLEGFAGSWFQTFADSTTLQRTVDSRKQPDSAAVFAYYLKTYLMKPSKADISRV